MQAVQSVKKKGVNYVRFSMIPMSQIEEKRLINKYTIRILNDPQKQWMITYRRYTNNRWDYLFRYIIETQVKQLWLSFNLQRTILKDISNVRFPYLIKLYVWQNNINSLQPLEFLNAPNLKQINLQKNQITNIKPLRKILSKTLNEINLSANPVNNLAPLQTVMLQTQLKGVFKQNRQDVIIMNDLTSLIKIKCNKITQLNLLSMNRIRQPKIQVMLLKRYPEMKLKVRQLGVNFYENHMIKKVIDTPRLEDQKVVYK